MFPLLPPRSPSLLSPSMSTETIKLMRPEVGAAAGGCSLSFPPPTIPFIALSLSVSLSSLILALLFLPPLFASPLSVCRFIISCLLLLADLCHSSKAQLCSGDRHFISALLTSWWRACVNMCVRDGSWLMGGGLVVVDWGWGRAGFVVVLLLLHTLRQR